MTTLDSAANPQTTPAIPQAVAPSAPRAVGARVGARLERGPERRLEGKIEVSSRAIATIAARAAAQCPGVVGLAPRHAGLRRVERLAPAHQARGVETRFVDDHVVIEIWVILERGVRVIEVAHAIMIGAQYAVEEALGLRVAQVNVNVQALAGPR